MKTRNKMLDFINIEGKVCAEIGVFTGEFSKEIYNRKPSHLFLVDPWCHQIVGYDEPCNVDNDLFQKYYNVIKMWSIQHDNVYVFRMLSNQFINFFQEEIFDFVFIDANHSEKATYNDLWDYWNLVKYGGWLCGYDYGHLEYPGVKLAVDRFKNDKTIGFDLHIPEENTYGFQRK